jgi:hypothetical protein
MAIEVSELEIINIVREDLGFPSETEMPESRIRRCLERGLVEYSKYRPIRRIGVFQTTKDVQTYDIGYGYAYLLDISDVHYMSPDTVESETGFFGSMIENVMDVGGLNTLANEGLRSIQDREISVLQGSTMYDWEQLERGEVKLIPCPTSSQSVYFVYILRKTVDDLKWDEMQDVVDFTFVRAARVLSNKRHKIVQASDAGSFVMFQSGVHLMNQADEREKALKRKFGIGSWTVHG